MNEPTLFRHCQTDPSAELLWVNKATTLTARQDFTALYSLASAQGEYWGAHQLLAEEQEEIARLRMGKPLFGICVNSLIRIDELKQTWRRAGPGKKDEVARFALTAVAISKLCRKILPPPPSIEERMPEKFQSPSTPTSERKQYDAFLKGFSNTFVELFPDEREQMGARMHLRPPFAVPHFEGDPPEYGSDTWYEGEGLLVHRQPSKPHPGTLKSMAAQGVRVNPSRLEMMTPYLQYDNRPLESHLV